MKFGVPLQILVLRTVTDKVSKFCILKMADGRHIENRFLAISQRFIVQLKWNWQEEAELCSDTGHVTKIQTFENARWRTKDSHFENDFITISQLWIIRFKWNLVCRCIIWFQERYIIKISKFYKFKMADGRLVCERLYVSLQISCVLWVNRRCPPILIVIQGLISDLYPLELLKVRHNINPYLNVSHPPSQKWL